MERTAQTAASRNICHVVTLVVIVHPWTAQVMLHQPSGGANGMAADIQIMAEEIIKTRARLNDIYAEHTGQVGTPEKEQEEQQRPVLLPFRLHKV